MLVASALLFACDNSTIDNNSIITKGDEEKLIHLKKIQWPQAYREQDTVLLNSLLAKEFQMIDAKGNREAISSHVSGVKKEAITDN